MTGTVQITWTNSSGQQTEVSATTPLPTTSTGSGITADQVQGNIADDAPDSGYPVKTGGVYKTAFIGHTPGDRADFVTDVYGNQRTATVLNSNGAVNGISLASGLGFAFIQNQSASVLVPASAMMVNNGTTADMAPGNTSGLFVQGNVASGVADVGNGVKMAGKYNATLPTLTDGQRGDAQLGANSVLLTTIVNSAGVQYNTAGTAADAGSTQSNGVLTVRNMNFGFNGATWDRGRSIVGAVAAGTGNTSVGIAPTSAAPAGIAPSTVAASVNSLKNSAGNFYGYNCCAGSTAGYFIAYNSATMPNNLDALTASLILFCLPVAANGSVSGMWDIPKYASAGIQFMFSTITTARTDPAVAALVLSGVVV